MAFHNIESVKFLVSEGADVNAKDEYGWTPLDVAKNSYTEDTVERKSTVEFKEIVKYLESKGAKSGDE